MSLRSPFHASILALSALLALPVGAAAQPAGNFNHYTVTDLGVLGAGTNSAGLDLNQAGWVGGSSNLTDGGPQHAFLWYGADPLQDLGTLEGASCPLCNSAADGPNANGEAPVGSEISAPDPSGEDSCGFGTHLQCLGAIWRDNRLTALPLLPGGRNANAFGINDMGTVVGFAETGVADDTCSTGTPFQAFQFSAVKWERDGSVHALAHLPDDTVSFAFGINNRGQTVGSSGTCATQGLPPSHVTGLHAVIWEKDGTPVYLGTLGDASNTMFNAATAINDSGDAVGTSQFTDGTVHSFLWKKGVGMQDLGTLPGAFATVAGCCNTVNNRDEVVGFSIDELGFRPFLWRDGVMVDLNTLVDSNSPLYLQSAYGINDRGEIVGQGCVLPDCTVLHAFRATPK